MCGRYSFASSKEKVNKQFGLQMDKELEKSYNIAPTHRAYVLTNAQPKQLQRFLWGLIPHWVNNPMVGTNLINARSETIATKASFRMPIRQKRCLVLADSFYEWKIYGRTKIPYRITLAEPATVMAFAGIWDTWRSPEGNEIQSFAIITTPANREMSWLHDRMPALLLSAAAQTRWLEDLPLEEALLMLDPPSDSILKMHPISDKINQPTYNEPDIWKPIEMPPTLFDFT